MRALCVILALAALPAAAEDLRIGASPTYPPYLGQTADGTLYGIDAELATQICIRGGYSCRWVDTEVKDLIPALVSGEVDIVMGGIGYSVARDQVIDFSCPYHVTEDAFGSFYGIDALLNPTTDPGALKVSVTRQSLHDVAMTSGGYRVIRADGNAAAIELVLGGAADLYFGSAGVVEAHPEGPGLAFLGTFPIPSTGAAVAVSEDRPDLRDAIDAILAEVSAEGLIADMQRRWLDIDQGDVIAGCRRPAPLS